MELKRYIKISRERTDVLLIAPLMELKMVFFHVSCNSFSLLIAPLMELKNRVSGVFCVSSSFF